MPTDVPAPPAEAPARVHRGSRRRRTRRVVLAVVLVVLAVGAELAIRAGEPRPVGPTGVDTLTIPLPQVEASDFVDGIDHRWWPMAPGSEWTWVPRAGAFKNGPDRWQVLRERREIAGVRTTTLVMGARSYDLAQDRDGNVWVLGGDVDASSRHSADSERWSVASGHPAGLFLPADPRRGDGHAMVVLEGRVSERVEVGERSGEPLVVPAGTHATTMDVEFVTVAQRVGEYGTSMKVTLAPGVGPVQVASVLDGVQRLQRGPAGG